MFNLSFIKSLFGLVHFIPILRPESSSAEIATPQMTFLCSCIKWSITLALNSILVCQTTRNTWPAWTTMEWMQSVQSCVCSFQISVDLLYFCATVSLQFEHVLVEGTFGQCDSTAQTSPSFFLWPPPLTLSMNCFPAYSSMLSLIHQSI